MVLGDVMVLTSVTIVTGGVTIRVICVTISENFKGALCLKEIKVL